MILLEEPSNLDIESSAEVLRGIEAGQFCKTREN